MNISDETSKKIFETMNNPNAAELNKIMNSVDKNKLFELFRQINPTEADIKRIEEQIKGMSKDELIKEVMKKLKG